MGRTQRGFQAVARQRGAVAIWVAISLLSLITAAFLAIDIARLYYSQGQLQKAATTAANSAVQIASGCVAGDGLPVGVSQITPVVDSIIRANGGSSSWLTGINGSPPIELGRTRTRTDGIRIFEPLAEGNPLIDSVRVNLSTLSPSSFVPGVMGGGTIPLVASSTARQTVIGSFYVGAGLLDLDTADSALLNPLLSALLGGNIKLTAVDYKGLADVNVSLDALAIALGVKVTDLSNLADLGLDTPLLPVILGGLVNGLGDVASGTVKQLLLNLAGAAQNKPVPLGPLLGPITDVVGAVPFINLLDLIVALGQSAAANPDGNVNPIVVPLGIKIPGVLTATVYLQVLEPPQFGIGRPGEATAKTAAIKLLVRISAGEVINGVLKVVGDLLGGILDLVTGLLQALTLGLVNIRVDGPTVLPKLNIGLDVNVAQAAASLDTVACPGIGMPNPVANLSASPAIASVHIGGFNGTPTATSAPALDTDTTTFDVLKLGIAVRPPLDFLGSLNLNVALDLSCVSVGGACYGPSEPSSGPFEPLPNPIDQFSFIKPVAAKPYYLAEGSPGDDPVPNENPQTVGSSLDVVVDLNLKTPITSGKGVLGGIAYVLNGLVTGILQLLDPLLAFVSNLLNSLVLPLLDLLGIHLGQATVTMESITVDRPLQTTICVPGAPLPRGCPAFGG